jgi:hypothetical protein
MRILSFGQVIDLERGGQFTQQITILLPDGRKAVIETDEDTIQRLIALAAPFVRGSEVKHFEPEEERYRQEESLEDSMDAASIFGGEEDAGERPAEPPMARMSEEPTETPPSNGGIGNGRPAPVRRPMVDKDGFALPVPSRTVEKDEMGYPVVDRRAAPPSGDDGADDGTQI